MSCNILLRHWLSSDLEEEIFAEWLGGVEEESVPPDVQNLPLPPNGDQETFSGNHPQLPCYATRFLSRAHVTRLLFKTGHLMTDVSYILHVWCHVTCKCAFLTDCFPILPQEKSLAMSCIREGAATVEITCYLFTHTMADPAPKQQQLASSSRQTKGTWIIVHTNEYHWKIIYHSHALQKLKDTAVI